MDLTQLAQQPAGTPPPGVTPNFDNPASDGYKFLVIATVFFVITLVLASLRFYVKVFVVHKRTLDDYLLALGLLASIGAYILYCYIIIVSGSGKHNWDVPYETVLSDHFLIPAFLQNVFNYTAWGLIKASFLTFYLHVFRPFIWLRYSMYVTLAASCAFYFSLIVAIICLSVPYAGQTWIDAFFALRYGQVYTLSIPVASGNLVLDIIILVLPMLGLAKLQLSLNRKLGVMCLFLTGFLACICSSLSVYYKYLLQLPAGENDFLYYSLPVFIMAYLEMAIGISAACMPALAQLKSKRPLQWSNPGDMSFVQSMKSLFGRSTGKSAYSRNSSEHIISDQGAKSYGKVDTDIIVTRSNIENKQERHEIWEMSRV